MYKKIYVFIPKSKIKKLGIGNLKPRLFKEFNKNTKVEIINDLVEDSNSIYFFIRWFDESYVKIIDKLKKKNNYLIYQILDENFKFDQEEYYRKLKHFSMFFDQIIFNSKHHRDKFKLDIKTSFTYHEYDIRFKAKEINDNIEYHGMIEKSSFTENLLKKFNIKHFKYSESSQMITNGYSCIHIDYVTNKNQYFHYHTSTKLSTALVLNCIFICNKVPVYYEILGNDYKFYITDDLSNLNEIIQLAKETINDKLKYNEYLDSVKKYKEILSPENINNEFMKIFNSI